MIDWSKISLKDLAGYVAAEMLHPIDSVKDRLAGFFHWNDKQNLEQAIKICMEQKIDFNELERWSISEKQFPKFEIFRKLVENPPKP